MLIEPILYFTIFMMVLAAITVVFPIFGQYLIGAIIFIFVIIPLTCLLFCSVKDYLDNKKWKKTLKQVIKIIGEVDESTAQAVTRKAMNSSNSTEFIATYARLHNLFPNANVSAICCIASEVMAGTHESCFVPYENSFSKVIDGEVFYMAWSKSKGLHWPKDPPKKPEINYYAKEKATVMTILDNIKIADEHLNKLASLVYFNWIFVTMTREGSELTFTFERRGEVMTTVVQEQIPKQTSE